DLLFIRTAPLLGCGNDSGVVAMPDERDLAPAERLGLLIAGASVLPYDHQLAAAVECHHEARDRPCIQGVADGARRAAVVLADGRMVARDRNPLGPDGDERDIAGPNAVAARGSDVVGRSQLQLCDAVLDGLDLQLEQVRYPHE